MLCSAKKNQIISFSASFLSLFFYFSYPSLPPSIVSLSKVIMELINDLVVTASLAIVLSFLVAKLISMAMGGRDSHSQTAGDVNFVEESLLRVQTHHSERKVQVASPESVKEVNGFTESDVAASVENVEVEQHPESDHVGLPVKSAEEDMVSEEVSVSQVGEIREEKMEEKEEVEEHGNGETAAEPEKEEIAVVGERDGEEREVNLEFEGKRKVEEHGNRETAAEPEVAAVNEIDEEEREVKLKFEEKRKVEEQGNGVTAAEPEKEEIAVVNGRDEEEKEVKLEFEEEEEDDGWEGIERSELEKVFMAATEFVAAGDKNERLASIGSDEQMELYGLHKLATEGPCRDPQPMPFMISARAKWNAWQKLGNMNPEVAMDQYITLLSDKVPGWMEDNSSGDQELNKSEQFDSSAIDSSTSLSLQQNLAAERELEQRSGAKNYSLLVESELGNKVKNDDNMSASIL